MFMPPRRCEKHGRLLSVSTTAGLAAAISGNQPVAHEGIRYLQYELFGRMFMCAVDVAFLEKYGLAVNYAVLVLRDRNRAARQLNDRLLIQRMTNELIRVCPVCIDGVIHIKRLQPPG